ncbi:pyrimidine-specific ribonucleoside hydrolase RihA [Candidatus Bathyarchaeota archaeon]|nr:MAG: pyrimidine-specific ribonucleoside hydrolase RihA [Candidatus Bathyarchaeota archaeon]
MDGGIDDALALILALRSPEIEVAGITAVSGNVPVEQATINALRVVELLERPDVWVAEGLARPLARDPIRAFNFHGRDGLGDSHLPLPKLRPTAKTALNAMSETLTSAKKHEVTIICTGPLTNLASLLIESPHVKSRIEEIVIMGGAYGITKYGVGNETPVAEFNIYSDPEAAKTVFEAEIRLKAVGLDVTTIPQLEIVKKDYARIRRSKGKISMFATRILESNIRAHGRFTLHDPMTVAVKIRPSFYRFSDCRVAIETKGEYTTGMTVADSRDLKEDQLLGGPVMVCSDVDPGFKRLFLDRLTGS